MSPPSRLPGRSEAVTELALRLAGAPPSAIARELDTRLAQLAPALGARRIWIVHRPRVGRPATLVRAWPSAEEPASLTEAALAGTSEAAQRRCVPIPGLGGVVILAVEGPLEALASTDALEPVAALLGAALARTRDAALDRATEALRRRGLSRTVSGLAHELNGPLGVIVTASTTLLRDEATPGSSGADHRLKATEIVVRNAKRAADRVRAYRAVFSADSDDTRRPVELVEHLRALAETMGPSLRRLRLQLSLELPDAPLSWVCVPAGFGVLLTAWTEHVADRAPTGPPAGIRLSLEATAEGARLHLERPDAAGDADATRDALEAPLGRLEVGDLAAARHAVEALLGGRLEPSPRSGHGLTLDLRSLEPPRDPPLY